MSDNNTLMRIVPPPGMTLMAYVHQITGQSDLPFGVLIELARKKLTEEARRLQSEEPVIPKVQLFGAPERPPEKLPDCGSGEHGGGVPDGGARHSVNQSRGRRNWRRP